jgi:hypothetical protein
VEDGAGRAVGVPGAMKEAEDNEERPSMGAVVEVLGGRERSGRWQRGGPNTGIVGSKDSSELLSLRRKVPRG